MKQAHNSIMPMIKTVGLFSVVVLFLLFSLNAQKIIAQTSFGLSGGGGFTQSTGFRAALPVEIQLGKSTFLFGGPAYLQRRNREIIRRLDVNRDYYSVVTDYISLPVLVKLRLAWKPIRVYAMAGIEVNYGFRLQATGLEDQRLFKETLDFSPLSLNRFDGGLSVGAGFEKDLHHRRKIFADLRYYLGILDIDDTKVGEIYNEGAYVTLGFLMPVGRWN